MLTASENLAKIQQLAIDLGQAVANSLRTQNDVDLVRSALRNAWLDMIERGETIAGAVVEGSMRSIDGPTVEACLRKARR